jgi:hypothetical protein
VIYIIDQNFSAKKSIFTFFYFSKPKIKKKFRTWKKKAFCFFFFKKFLKLKKFHKKLMIFIRNKEEEEEEIFENLFRRQLRIRKKQRKKFSFLL